MACFASKSRRWWHEYELNIGEHWWYIRRMEYVLLPKKTSSCNLLVYSVTGFRCKSFIMYMQLLRVAWDYFPRTFSFLGGLGGMPQNGIRFIFMFWMSPKVIWGYEDDVFLFSSGWRYSSRNAWKMFESEIPWECVFFCLFPDVIWS